MQGLENESATYKTQLKERNIELLKKKKRKKKKKDIHKDIFYFLIFF